MTAIQEGSLEETGDEYVSFDDLKNSSGKVSQKKGRRMKSFFSKLLFGSNRRRHRQKRQTYENDTDGGENRNEKQEQFDDSDTDDQESNSERELLKEDNTARSSRDKAQPSRKFCIYAALCLVMIPLVIKVVSPSVYRSIFGRRRSFHQNFFVGTQAIFSPQWDPYRVSPFYGHGYDEDGYDMLTELREAIATSGMNLFKFKLSPSTCASYRLYNCASYYGDDDGGNGDDDQYQEDDNYNDDDSSSSSSSYTLTDLAQEPEIAATFADDRFLWYHIWTYSFNRPKPLRQDWTDDTLAAEYDEMYNVVKYLLETYPTKVFYFGNWEGDWELMGASGCKSNGQFDTSCVPTDEVIDRYVAWATVRQEAVHDARRDVGEDGTMARAFYYIEFNMGSENFEGDYYDGYNYQQRPTILNSVASLVDPDYLSYSGYKSTNRYVNHGGQYFNQSRVDELFYEILDYAESKLSSSKPPAVLGSLSKRVFVGEFGPHSNVDSTLARTTVAEVIRAALEWGCPFVLQWEVYDNYSTFPLFPRYGSGDDGGGGGVDDMYTDFTPLRELYVEWRAAATDYINSLSSSSPEEDLRFFAIDWFTNMQESY